MKLNQTGSVSAGGLPELARGKIRLLWASGYRDGVVDGLARLGNEDVWYSLAEESDDAEATGWFRRYWLVRLSPHQLEAERTRHEDFRRFVGTHWDYDEHGRCDLAGILPEAEHHKFYDKYPENERGPGDLGENEVLGWFQW